MAVGSRARAPTIVEALIGEAPRRKRVLGEVRG